MTVLIYDYMIYPKQFRSAKIPIEKNYCFFLMPFKEEFDSIYGTIKDMLIDYGYVCNRADELTDSKPIINKILTEFLKAQYIIVDLTDCNPNVFYELGITHTFKDAQNVLLLKQKNSKIPFDITHLQYREYNPENLKQLASIIREFISKNQYISEFYEALNIHGVINLVYDNNENFLDYLQQRFGEDIVVITSILNKQTNELREENIEEFLDKYQLFVHNVINAHRFDILNGILKLYTELLIAVEPYIVAETHISFFLNDFFAQHNLSESDVLGYKTDLAVALAKKRKHLSIVLPWIIQYLSKSKSASIDLNRYKLEGFLMTSNIEEVNRSIINGIFSQDCHVREHLADIIGEKRLEEAKGALCTQLAAEQNDYTAVSIIEAIGKIGTECEIRNIVSWINVHEKDLVDKKMLTVFRHAQIAISRLDKSEDKLLYQQFSSQYSKYLHDYIPL